MQRRVARLLVATLPGLASPACILSGDAGEIASLDERGPATTREPPGPVPRSPTALAKIAPPYDVASTAATIAEWPRLFPGVRAHAVTSYDRSGGNDDGFGGTYTDQYVDVRGEHVVFDAIGPGVVRTFWLTSAIDGNSPLGLGRVRFYFDDEERPRVDLDADALFAGDAPPFVTPLVHGNLASSGGFASWAPLPYARRLRITTERRAGFVQIHHEKLPPNWDVTSSTAVDTKSTARFAATGPSTLPLEIVPLDVTRAGSGVVDVFRFEPDVAPSDAELRAARITLWFDGSATPAVDVPLGAFFGSALGVAPVRSIVWTMDPTRFESRMPMPFASSFRARITGLAGKASLHVGPALADEPNARVGRLEAVHQVARPTTPGQDFTYVETKGSGKVVATVLLVEPIAPSMKQWWEGDQRTTVDGLRTPVIHGTGHEDDHLGGWSNEFLSRPFTLPMQGVPKTVILDPNGQVNADASMYRLWAGIPFLEGVRHSTEHGPSNAREANYEAVTFLYRRPEVRLARSDGFLLADPADARAHAYAGPAATAAPLTSAFEGERADPFTATPIDLATATSFTLAVPPDNEGVFLRRTFDRASGTTRATIVVDDVAIADVASLGPYAETRRWAEDDTFLPPEVTRNKSTLTITIVPKSTINAARVEAWAVRP